MTLIVGIKCSDGVVVGADGAATYGSMGNATIRQTVKKLRVLQGQAIIGSAGAVGLGQRISDEVNGLVSTRKFARGSAVAVMGDVRKRLLEPIKIEMEAAQAIHRVVPGETQAAVTHTLLAVGVGSDPCLCQFNPGGAPELATVDLPFVTLGSGQPIADPFVAFVRRVFWPDSQPTLAEGIFATVWALQHAIATNPGGVADPIQVAVLERAASTSSDRHAPQWIARELSAAECEEHRQGIEAAERALKEWRSGFGSGAAAGAPSIPTPPGGHSTA